MLFCINLRSTTLLQVCVYVNYRMRNRFVKNFTYHSEFRAQVPSLDNRRARVMSIPIDILKFRWYIIVIVFTQYRFRICNCEIIIDVRLFKNVLTD